jgi:hypothetical protein
MTEEKPVRAVTYCSFADPDKCLGVAILTGALDPVAAAKRAWALKVNPGGELIAMPYQEAEVSPELFEAMWNNRDRLITDAEARVLFGVKSILEMEDKDEILSACEMVRRSRAWR